MPGWSLGGLWTLPDDGIEILSPFASQLLYLDPEFLRFCLWEWKQGTNKAVPSDPVIKESPVPWSGARHMASRTPPF